MPSTPPIPPASDRDAPDVEAHLSGLHTRALLPGESSAVARAPTGWPFLRPDAEANDLETRIAALEILVVELGSWIGAAGLEEATRDIRARIDGRRPAPEEVAAAEIALALIRAALKRLRPPLPHHGV